METLSRPVRLPAQESRLLFIQLDISLLLVQLDLINIINLLDIGIVHEVHDAAPLEPRLHPQEVGVDGAVAGGDAVLRLDRFDEDAGEAAEGRVAGPFVGHVVFGHFVGGLLGLDVSTCDLVDLFHRETDFAVFTEMRELNKHLIPLLIPRILRPLQSTSLPTLPYLTHMH